MLRDCALSSSRANSRIKAASKIGDLRVIFEIEWTEKRIGVLAIVPRGKAY